jgi:hypothetical protein
MAVALEFISLIIPIQNIDKVYQGGFERYKIDNAEAIGRNVWYDEYLLRDGAMGWDDIEVMLEEWKNRGLELVKMVDGHNEWLEVCVLYDFDGPSLPCDWIVSEYFSFQARLKGVPIGRLVNRDNVNDIVEFQETYYQNK